MVDRGISPWRGNSGRSFLFERDADHQIHVCLDWDYLSSTFAMPKSMTLTSRAFLRSLEMKRLPVFKEPGARPHLRRPAE